MDIVNRIFQIFLGDLNKIRVRMDIDVALDAKWLCHVSFDNPITNISNLMPYHSFNYFLYASQVAT
jgi:hypothetical protein